MFSRPIILRRRITASRYNLYIKIIFNNDHEILKCYRLEKGRHSTKMIREAPHFRISNITIDIFELKKEYAL